MHKHNCMHTIANTVPQVMNFTWILDKSIATSNLHIFHNHNNNKILYNLCITKSAGVLTQKINDCMLKKHNTRSVGVCIQTQTSHMNPYTFLRVTYISNASPLILSSVYTSLIVLEHKVA